MSVRRNRGITQIERFPPALAPRSIVLDERPFTVLMAMAPHYAKMLNFYDATGDLAGDWQPFFDSDHTFLLAEICAWNPQDKDATHVPPNNTELDNSDWGLLSDIFNMIVAIDQWLQRLTARKLAALKPVPDPFLDYLHKIITQELKTELRHITSHPAHWRAWVGLTRSTDPVTKLALLWELTTPAHKHAGDHKAPHGAHHGSPDASSIRSGTTPDLSRIKLIVAEACRVLKSLAKEYLILELEQHDHLPQGAMYMAFLKLFRLVQLDMNSFTERHLEYYYKTVLRLQPMDGEPDIAMVVVQLASTSAQYQLAQGTQMTAGSDPMGNKILFSTIKPVVISQASIQSLAALHAGGTTTESGTTQPIGYIHAAPVANSQNGLGAPLTDPERGWPTFGPCMVDSIADNIALNANQGLVIASSVLLLQEGTRNVSLVFSFTDPASAQTQTNAYVAAYVTAFPAISEDMQINTATILANAFLLYVSTKAGWLPITDFYVETPSDSSAPFNWNLTFTLTNDAVALVANASLYPGIATDRPMLKLLLNPNALIYPYSYFQTLTLASVDIHVAVTGLQTINVETVAGPVATGKPFGPFGAVPVTGASFDVVAEELIAKKINSATLTLEWLTLPATDFTTYYAGYAPYPFNDAIFKVNLYVATNGKWLPQTGNVPPGTNTSTTAAPTGYTLFTQDAEDGASLSSQTAFTFDTFTQDASGSGGSNTLSLPVTSSPNSITQAMPGTLSVELIQPSYAFGNALYPTLFAEWAVKSVVFIETLLTKSATGTPVAPLLPITPTTTTPPVTPAAATATANLAAKEEGSAPNPPFSPTINRISLNYSASETIELVAVSDTTNALASKGLPFQFYQIYPFGYALPPQVPPTLFPVAPGLGQLFIGLINLTPPQPLNLYFEFREKNATQFSLMSPAAATATTTSTATSTAAIVPPIAWRYLSNNQWKEFPTNTLVSNTNNFTNSGMVEIQIPSDMNAGNSMMSRISGDGSDNLFWLSAYTNADPSTYNTTVAIWPQAIETSRVTPTSTEVLPLPANTIIALSQPVAEVKNLTQPYPSRGGRAKENVFKFQARVAERLKHKQRAILPGDFELLVLEAFPAVWQAKCITANNSTATTTNGRGAGALVAAGEVVLALSPPIEDMPQQARPLPAATLELVASHLQSLASPFIRKITVRNLSYDSLTVSVKVVFKSNKKTSLYQSELNQLICDYLSPWKLELQPYLTIGVGSVVVADLARLIRSQPYVEQIGPVIVTQAWQSDDGYGLETIDESGTAFSKAPWSVLVPVAQHRIVAVTDGQLEPDVGVGSLVIGGDFIIGATPSGTLANTSATAKATETTRIVRQEKKLYTLVIPKTRKNKP